MADPDRAWVVADGHTAEQIPSVGGRYLADVSGFESACQSVGLQAIAKDWSSVDVGRPPRALLGIATNNDAGPILALWNRMRQQRQNIRLVMLYAESTQSASTGIERMLDGSVWTQIMRTISAQV